MGDEENTFDKVGDFIVETSANGCLAFVYKPGIFPEAKLVKTFRGETAWSDAKRWAWDSSVSADFDLLLSAPTLRRVV